MSQEEEIKSQESGVRGLCSLLSALCSLLFAHYSFQRIIAIFLLLPLFAYPKGFSDWLEKKIDVFIKEELKRYSRDIKIERIKYIFPNKLALSGISYSKDGFFLKGNGLLEVRIGEVPKVTLLKPRLLIKRDFFKKKEKIHFPNIEIIIENGNGKISSFGLFDNICGSLLNKKFSFNGKGWGGLASIKGTSDNFIACIKDAKISLLPYLVGIKKEGRLDITIKKEKETEIVADIKDCSIKDVRKIKGRLEWKGGKSEGRLSFLWNNLPCKIKFEEKKGFYKTNGDFCYNKITFPFSIDGLWKNNVFKITKGNIKNVGFFGEIGKNIKLSLFFNNENNILPLIHPILKGVILNGAGTIAGFLEKPNITGSLTLTKNNEVLDIFISGDNNLLYLNTGTISLFGINLASAAFGTISLFNFGPRISDLGFSMPQSAIRNLLQSAISISCNLINPILFKDGKIETNGNLFEASFFSEKRRLFLKGGLDKPIRFNYTDLVKQIPLDLSGEIIFEKDYAKVLVGYGKIGEIPINNGLANIRLKDGLKVESLELLVDSITTIHSSFEIEKDKIDAPILITNIKTDRFLKNLKGKGDFKGRLIGDIKKPSIFGQLYSPDPKLMADIVIIENSFILKNGRIDNTVFELKFLFSDKSISGFAGFENEELSRISNIFLIPPYISGKADGSATFCGSVYNPEITGSIAVKNPIFFGGDPLNVDSMKLMFKVKDRVLQSTSLLTSFPGFISFNTNISSCGSIETNGNISSFSLAELPLTGSFSFKGTYSNGAMEGTLSISNIITIGYKIPDITEGIKYYPDKGLSLSGWLSGTINKGICDILLQFDNLAIAPCMIKGSITVRGETGDLEIDGEINIIGSNLKIPIFQDTLDEVSCKISINEGVFKVLSFYGKTKKTKIVMKQIIDNTYEVNTEGEAIKIDIPGIIKGEASCELEVKNIEKDLICNGKIIVSNSRFTYPPTKKGNGSSFLDQFIYGPKIEAGHNVWFYNEFCEVNIEKGGWVRFVKEKDIIKASGYAHSKRGRVEYLGSNFIISNANFEFRDGIPYLEGSADWTKGKIPLTLSHNGMILEPLNLSLFSKEFPEKTQEELVSLLQEKKEKPAGFIAGIVGGRITKQLSESIRNLTRCDLEVITPFPEKLFSGTETYTYGLVGTEVKIGKYLTKRFYLIYEGTIEDYEEERYKYKHRIGFEYDIGKGTGLRYLYTPLDEKKKEDHEIGIKKSISF